MLIVDDSSPDGTGRIADRLAAEHDEVEVLHRAQREGLGPAYIAGFRRALGGGAGYVFEMDADFSHDPADLAAPAGGRRAGADLALGSRYVPGGGVEDWGLLRRFVSRGGCYYARNVLGLEVHDLTGGFKCFRREVLEAIELDTVRSHGYGFQVELTQRALRRGFIVREVPIMFRDRLPRPQQDVAAGSRSRRSSCCRSCASPATVADAARAMAGAARGARPSVDRPAGALTARAPIRRC